MKIKMYLLKNLVLSLSLFALMQAAHAQDPDFHIYLCLGQSNMEGYADIENQDLTNIDSRFRILQAVNCAGQPEEVWRTATPPLSRCNTKLGPADYFGRTMVKNLPPAIKIGIVHVAIAGCKIELFDKNNYRTYVQSLPASEDWKVNIINSYGGNPYARLVELARIAQKEGVIKGILLHQGESNTNDEEWPDKVKAVYNNLTSDLSLEPSQTPLLVGELIPTNMGGLCGSHNAIIAKVPTVIPNSYVISANGLAGQSDKLHFTAASYRTLGERYAQQMLRLLPSNVTGFDDDTKLHSVTVYPNPFMEKLHLELEGSFRYELQNVLGHTITSGEGEGRAEITSQLQKGIFILQIYRNNHQKTIQVIKE